MSDFEAFRSSTPLAAGNAPYVEALYEQFLADPASVEPKWREYFAGLGGAASEVPHGPLVEQLAQRARVRRPGGGSANAASPDMGSREKVALRAGAPG